MLEDRLTSSFVVPASIAGLLWSHMESTARRFEDARLEELRTTTIYFDTENLALHNHLWDNHHPVGNRKQVRLRIYDELDPLSCFFEFKWHDNDVSHKRRLPIRVKDIHELGKSDFRPEDSLLGGVWDQISKGILVPRLRIRYHRLAIESKNERFTLDSHIEYSIPSDSISRVSPGFSILEIKSAVDFDEIALRRELVQPFMHELGPSVSKCEDGMRRLYAPRS